MSRIILGLVGGLIAGFLCNLYVKVQDLETLVLEMIKEMRNQK